MKKINKITLLLVTVLTFMFGINNIKALDVTFHEGTEVESETIKYNGTPYHHRNYWISYGEKPNAISRKAYCIDADLNADAQNDEIVVQEIIDFSNLGDNYDKYINYYGMYYILEHGEQSYTVTDNNKENMIATDIAIRAYSNVILGLAKSSSPSAKEKAILNFGIQMALTKPLETVFIMNLDTMTIGSEQVNCKSSAENASKCINQFIRQSVANYLNQRLDSISELKNEDTLSGKDLSKAETLMKDAIQATYDLKMNKNRLAKYTVSVGNTSKVKDEATGQYLTEIKEINFKIENLPNGGYVNVNRNDIKFAKNGLNSEVDIVISSVEYLDTDGTWKTLGTDNVNLAEKKNSDNIAKLRITWKQPPSESNKTCDAQIDINYRTFDPRYKFYLLGYKDNDGSNTQTYYGLVENEKAFAALPEESGETENSTFSFPISPVCNAVNACETKIQSPVCADDKDGIATVEGPSDIKTCVINKADDAGNTYNLSNTNGGVNNRYCSTYCKEDYATIKLNRGVKDPMPKCGGYFRLNASIVGSEECYHASPDSPDMAINHDLFIQDIVDAQVNLAEAYNLYIKARKAEDQEIQLYKENGKVYAFIQDTYTAYILGSTDANGKITWTTEERPYEYRSNFIDDEDKAKDEVTNAIKADLEKAQKDLSQDSKTYNDDTAYDKFLNIIRNYNACTSSWNHTFKFDQKIYWGYSEKFDELVSEDARDMAIVENSKQVNSNIYICTGNVDNGFENCSTNWRVVNNGTLCTSSTNSNSNLLESCSVKWEYDQTNDPTLYSSYSFRVFDVNGPHEISQAISNAKFVKQTSNASAEYVTPEVFYQVASSGPASGAITTNKDFKDPNIQLTPVGGLPIDLDSTGGGSFRLRVDGLGEFYGSGDSGRIIGYVAENNKLERKLSDQSVAYAILKKLTPNIDENGDGKCDKNCDTDKDGIPDSNLEFGWGGDYRCHFYNECKPDIPECPECDYECVGPFCDWIECPTCTAICVNCIYNLGKLQLNNKQISITDFDSADREYGYNWNINTLTGDLAKQLKLIQDKAKETREEIEASNEKIYDDSNPTDENSELDFSITLKASDMNWIRNYNKEAEKNGGYGNQSLECYDYEGTDKKVYSNQFCYSTFIDELESNGTEIVAKGRDEKGDRTESENSRILKSTSTYWEPWDKTHESLTEYRNKFGEDVIGGIASK